MYRALPRACLWTLCVLLAAGCDSRADRSAAHLATAQSRYDAGDMVEARLELRNALQLAPANARALYLLALIDEREAQYAAVVAGLEQAVRSEPAFPDARIKLGNYYAVAGRVAETREQANAAISLAPSSAAARLLNARACFLEGDIARALDQASHARLLDPARPDVITFIASLHAAEGRHQDALQVLDEALDTADPVTVEGLRQARVSLLVRSGALAAAEAELHELAAAYPRSPTYPLALAQLFSATARPEDAERSIRALIARDPDNAEWRMRLAGLIAGQGRLQEASAGLEQASRQNPASTTLRMALGDFHERSGNVEKALAVYRDLAAAAPRSEDGLAARNRMVVLTAPRDETQARQQLAEILADAPGNVDALLARAAFSFSDDRFRECIADLRSALARQPDSVRGLLMLARAGVRSGQADVAEEGYRKLLSLQPGHAAARNELAALVANQGGLAEAEQLLRDALRINPQDTASASSLVATLLARGEASRAEIEARRMLSIGEASGLADYQLGVALQLQNQTGPAIAAFRDAIRRNPLVDEPLVNLTRLLLLEGRATEAESLLRQHVRAYPAHTTARLWHGRVLRELGRTAEARELYEQLLREQPDNAKAWLGLAGLSPQQPDEQLAVLLRGHKQLPADTQVAIALAGALQRRGDYEQAIGVLDTTYRAGGGNDLIGNNLAALLLDYRDDAVSHRRALEIASRFESASHPFFLGVLGWAHFRNGNLALAQRFLERAVAAEPAQLRYYLGMTYIGQGNEAAGALALRQSVDEAETEGIRFTGLDEARRRLALLPPVQPGTKSP